MKRLLSLSLAAAVAASALGSTAAMAQPYPPGPPGHPPPPAYNRPPPPPYHRPPPPPRPGWHQWHRGDRYYGSRYPVNNWRHYGLRPPPPGYVWVQNSGQFVLIAAATGLITSVILNSAAR